MMEFWSSVPLMSECYHGSPAAKHEDTSVDSTHFVRSQALFDVAVREHSPSQVQTHFMERGHRNTRGLAGGGADQSGGAVCVPILAGTGASQ